MQEVVVATGGCDFKLSVKAKVRMAELENTKIFCYKYDNSLNSEGEYVDCYNKIDFSDVIYDDNINISGTYVVTSEDLGERVKSDECESAEYKEDIKRDDKTLVLVVRELGESAGGYRVEPAIVQVPDGVKWEIDRIGESDVEYVCEVHGEWYAGEDAY
jgi:hypothetical protein